MQKHKHVKDFIDTLDRVLLDIGHTGKQSDIDIILGLTKIKQSRCYTQHDLLDHTYIIDQFYTACARRNNYIEDQTKFAYYRGRIVSNTFSSLNYIPIRTISLYNFILGIYHGIYSNIKYKSVHIPSHADMKEYYVPADLVIYNKLNNFYEIDLANK